MSCDKIENPKKKTMPWKEALCPAFFTLEERESCLEPSGHFNFILVDNQEMSDKLGNE